MDRRVFKAEVKKQLTLRNWSYTELSKHTKYTAGSIRTILSTPGKLTASAIEDIASALNIDVSKLEDESAGVD